MPEGRRCRNVSQSIPMTQREIVRPSLSSSLLHDRPRLAYPLYRYPDGGFSPNRIFFPPQFPSPFPSPFSRSSGLNFGVGGTSSTLARRFDRGPPSLSSLGNSVRRGVRAVTTFLADLRMFSRTFHSLFLAMKNRTAEATIVEKRC